MIHVYFNPDNFPPQAKTWWDNWILRADAARQEAIKEIEAGKKFSEIEQTQIWTELKWFLFNGRPNNPTDESKPRLMEPIFNEKCAYCETKIIRFNPDMEHYRPKGKVKEDPDHPGYFWLAYDWENLVPSCEFCNAGLGKQNQFPVQRQHLHLTPLDQCQIDNLNQKPYPSENNPGSYYLRHDDLNELETPLLLHPFSDYPSEHLIFGDFGEVVSKKNDSRGTESIKVFRLDGGSLKKERWEFQKAALNKYLAARQDNPGSIDDKRKAGIDRIKEYLEGNERYSAAVWDYIKLNEIIPETIKAKWEK